MGLIKSVVRLDDGSSAEFRCSLACWPTPVVGSELGLHALFAGDPPDGKWMTVQIGSADDEWIYICDVLVMNPLYGVRRNRVVRLRVVDVRVGRDPRSGPAPISGEVRGRRQGCNQLPQPVLKRGSLPRS